MEDGDEDFAFHDELFEDPEETADMADDQMTSAITQIASGARESNEVPEEPPKIESIKALFPNAPENLFPVVVGTIAQASLGVGVDLRKLSCGTRNVEFIPTRSAVATMRLRDPSCACLIRNSGFITITGAASTPAARRAAEICARIIRKVLGLTFTSFQFRVRSVMTRFNLGHPIRLEELKNAHPSICSYEPESFCGAIVKLRGPSTNEWAVTCTVFVTGKVTMLGARSTEEVRYAFHTLLPLLEKFAKK